MRLLLLCFSAVGACTAAAAPLPTPMVPAGASIEPSGFATILSAPPLPYPDDPPPYEAGQSEPERLARRLDISVSEAEARMNPDEGTRSAAMALCDRLRREAAGNFVDMRIVRDPLPRFAFHFRRDAARTLARFTSDPRFLAVDGGVPAAELEPLMHEWLARLAPRRLASSGSVNPFSGMVEIFVGVGRSEYEAVAAAEGWRLPPRVRLRYAPEIDPRQAVAPDVAPFVRSFARADHAPDIVLASATFGTILLRDGCFRTDVGKGAGRLVLFGRMTRLYRDPAGYLTVASVTNPDSKARIGEQMVWGGYPPDVEEEAGVKALRQHCGAGDIVSVGEPTSAHAFRVRPWAIAEYARARGLSRRQAWDRIKACWAREDARRVRQRPGHAPPRSGGCDEPGR